MYRLIQPILLVLFSSFLFCQSVGYNYVIITPDNPGYLSWADSLKNFRTLQGINTGIVTLNEIGGNDVTLIRNFINNAYYTWDVPPAAVLG